MNNKDRVKINPNVPTGDLEIITQTVKDGIALLSDKKYGLGIQKQKATKIALRVLSVRNFPTRHGGLGGANTIFVNLGRWEKQLKERFQEYKRFANDPDIGTVAQCTYEQWMRLLTLHELSHHIQRRYARRSDMTFPYDYSDWSTSHGVTFKTIYRILRIHLINDEFNCETKAQKFTRLAETRTNKAIKSIELIGNLATSNYEYNKAQALTIIKELKTTIKDVEQQFTKRSVKKFTL